MGLEHGRTSVSNAFGIENQTVAQDMMLTPDNAGKNASVQVLELTGGNKTKASSILQIDYSTLLRKIKIYGIPL